MERGKQDVQLSTYHTGTAADHQGPSVGQFGVTERGVEGGLAAISVPKIYAELHKRAGRTKLMTLKLRRQALI